MEPNGLQSIGLPMKRIAGALALSLLLVGCATNPYGQQYPQDPYGGGGYPPAGYPGTDYPPAGYPPAYGQQPGRPAPGPCPIAGSRDWTAHINAMPGPNAQAKLIVSGTVQAPTGGHSFAFEPYLQIRESYPAQAFATLVVTQPTGPATQAVTTHDLRWEWPVTQEIGSIEIRCGNQTLATISPLQRAY